MEQGVDLGGKSVLVTGGGSGLGADLARGFAAAGARVVIAGRREAALREVAARTGAQPVVADVTDAASVAAMFAAAGDCDIVIANAGGAEAAPFASVSLADWNASLAVNLTGVFLTLQGGLARMNGWGRLIAIASTAGLKGFAQVAPYCAAKHGVIGLVRSLSRELARREVTVNALCPGYLDTEMTARSVAGLMARGGMEREKALATLLAANPQRRLIRPEEVTAAALWLCGPGSESITGQAIAVAGGEV